MAFCTNCGNQLQDGANFCAFCGTLVTNANYNNKRNMVYDGDLHKCPNCGELLNSFVSSCPTCGYELRNSYVTNAIKDFVYKISIAQTDEQRFHLISNFAIPNTKEDIMEFLIIASTNAESGCTTQAITNAWLVKLDQCYYKAQLMLSKDLDYPQMMSIYEKTYKSIKKKNKKLQSQLNRSSVQPCNTIERVFRAIAKTLGMIASVMLFLFAIYVDQSGGNSSGLELIGGGKFNSINLDEIELSTETRNFL